MSVKTLFNQRGDIAVAILVSVVAVLSGLSLSMVAGRDATAALYQYDEVQELSLLRSEIRRGFAATSNMPTTLDSYYLPIRYVQITNSFARTTYALKTLVGRSNLPSGLTQGTHRGISCKVKAFRRPAKYVTYSGNTNKSPIETYGMKIIQKETFAGYMYLTNYDTSVNGENDPVYFYGADELYGRVHSNTNIWCKNVNGWPTFHGHVSTAGVIQYTPSPPDPDDLFLDGYTENAGEIEFSPTATLIRQHGGTIYSEYDIAFIQMIGRDYHANLAVIDPILPADTLIVYNVYPPYGAVGDSINVNYVTFMDTTWIDGGSGCIEGSSKMVEAGQLWICGECQGEQTWGSAGNMKLVDDITYHYTDRGEAPDGADGGAINRMDYLGLVSEQKIDVQYGLFDPRDSTRHRYNCDGDAEGIWIYGAMAAIADGEGNTHEDGVFQFEYQHPHYSTVNTWYQGEYFDYIDLHLCKWEPLETSQATCWPWPAKGYGGYSYAAAPPGSPDYPWYNPLWPEAVPYKERGKIHIYGSVAQVRRGFVHRSGSDHMDQGYWSMDDYMYGPEGGVYGVDAPGATGTRGIGYIKDYHYDNRFRTHPPVDFPEVNIVGQEGKFDEVSLRFMRPPRNF